jgi:hypothetical protein
MSHRWALLAIAGMLLFVGGFAAGFGIATLQRTSSVARPTPTVGPRFTAAEVIALARVALGPELDACKKEAYRRIDQSPEYRGIQPLESVMLATYICISSQLGTEPAADYRGNGQWFVRAGGEFAFSVRGESMTASFAGGPWIFDEDIGKLVK